MSEAKSPQESKARRREYFVIYLLCVALLAGLAVLWARQQGYLRGETAVTHHPGRLSERPIELNSANWWELTQVRGIGEVRAKAIIDLRNQKHGFSSFDELVEVKGVTPEIIEEMKKIMRLEPPAPPKEKKP
jgi:competence protein ComEA